MTTFLHTGYASRDYAFSLTQLENVLPIKNCGGYLLRHSVMDDSVSFDLTSPYPFFCCRHWADLDDDLRSLDSGFLSISILTDPFGNVSQQLLKKLFPDSFFLFKNHFVVDLAKNWQASICKHHRRNIATAQKTVTVEHCAAPLSFLENWCALYRNLVHRHTIKGFLAFSEDCFRKQFQVPGLDLFRAQCNGKTIGMTLWMVQADKAYYHLGAHSDIGYNHRASYALFDFALNHYAANAIRYLNLGAGPGLKQNATDGLSRFKAGWANDQRPVYFCGKILNPAKYNDAVKHFGTDTASYFPAYRVGEFQ